MSTNRNIYTGRYPDIRTGVGQWFRRWMCKRNGHGALRLVYGEWYCRMCGMDARNIRDDGDQQP